MSGVLITVPNLNWIHQRLCNRLLQWAGSSIPTKIWTPARMAPVDHARNKIVKHFLEEEENKRFDRLWMIDNDTIPPPNALDLLFQSGAGVVSGITPTMKEDPNDGQMKRVWMALKEGTAEDGSEGLVEHIPDDLEENPVQEVDAVGASCLMIKREVLERVPAPHFEFSYDDEGIRQDGEDFSFCEKVKNYGFSILADYRVRCEHCKEVSI